MSEKKSEIRIYQSFTEVRENVKASAPYVIYLPQDLFNQIMSGSLSLEGVRTLSMNSISKDTNLEGKLLHLHKGEKVRQVKVIRGRDLLVQDVETQRYFNANREQLEFSDVPEESGTEVTFVLEKEGDAVLSYLMYGINWKPRYNLSIVNDKHDFQGWADINNNTQQEYTIDKTELFGGDVAIRRPRQEISYEFAPQTMMRSAGLGGAPKIESQGEMSGLYMYAINDKYVLAPRSTFSLPFASPTIALEKLAVAEEYFSESNNKGKFSRVYRISSSEFLPSGSITVREDGRVVGQSNIPDLSVNEKNDVSVGSDADVSFERNVKTLEVKCDFTKYEVSLSINNNKNRPVKVEFTENLGNKAEILTQEPKLDFANNSLKYVGTVPANNSVSIKYSFNLFTPNNSNRYN